MEAQTPTIENHPKTVLEAGEIPKIRLKSPCQICQIYESKYKCPNCLLKSCSLKCVREHKIRKNCDGIYHFEKFIPAEKYCKRDLKKDLFYIDEMMNKQERVRKKV